MDYFNYYELLEYFLFLFYFLIVWDGSLILNGYIKIITFTYCILYSFK